MSDWGNAKGIEGNYEEDSEESPEAGASFTQFPEAGPAREEPHESSATQSDGGSCQASTRKGTPCTNDAIDGGYCGHHAPNGAGEFTWRFTRHQMYMQEGEAKELSRVRKRIELNHNLEFSKKEFERSIFELILENGTVRKEFVALLVEKYHSD